MVVVVVVVVVVVEHLNQELSPEYSPSELNAL